MGRIKKNEEIEDRIYMEAIVDAYNQEEKAIGWYYYLDDKIRFPFEADCIKKLTKSPLNEGEKVTVLGLAEEGNLSGIYVEIKWKDRVFAVPLEQLSSIDVDSSTEEAINDWKYWVERGYEF